MVNQSDWARVGVGGEVWVDWRIHVWPDVAGKGVSVWTGSAGQEGGGVKETCVRLWCGWVVWCGWPGFLAAGGNPANEPRGKKQIVQRAPAPMEEGRCIE